MWITSSEFLRDWVKVSATGGHCPGQNLGVDKVGFVWYNTYRKKESEVNRMWYYMGNNRWIWIEIED